MNEVHSLRAEFDQTVFDQDGEVIERSQGTMAIERPGRFRWHYMEPYEQLIVGDSQRIWVYDKDLEQVTVKPQSRKLSNAASMLLSGQSGLSENFVIHESRVGEDNVRVTLKARDPDEAQFTQARLEFHGRTLAIMHLSDNLGQTTRLEFSKVETNPALDNTLFQFEPPKGVDVVGSPLSGE